MFAGPKKHDILLKFTYTTQPSIKGEMHPMSQALALGRSNLPSLTSIESYISWVQKIPVLSPEEEKNLTDKIYRQGVASAAKDLIYAHLRFVVYVARSYLGYGLSQADLIQEGNIGLMKAAKKFNPDVGVRFSSFAVYWVKSEIQEFVLKNWRIVKIATTKTQRKLFFKMRRYVQSLRHLSQQEVNKVSHELSVPQKDVWSMQERLYGHDHSMSQATDDDQPGKDSNITRLLPPSSEASLEDSYVRSLESETYQQQLKQSILNLSERDQIIIKERWLQEPKSTLHELAAKLDVSPERVRQLEQKALQKIKQAIIKKDPV